MKALVYEHRKEDGQIYDISTPRRPKSRRNQKRQSTARTT
jgi:hypothetical protein